MHKGTGTCWPVGSSLVVLLLLLAAACPTALAAKPVLSPVTLASNGETGFAKTGNTITLQFTASEALTASPTTVTIAGTDVSGSASVSGLIYTYTHVVQGTEAEAAVIISVSGYSDSATTTDGDPVSVTTDSSAVIIDYTIPVITCPTVPSPIDGTVSDGATVVYSTAGSATDTNIASSTVSCDRNSSTVFPFGSTTVTCTATDDAGNTATCTFSVVIQDTTAPTLTSITMISSGPDGLAKSGDVISVLFTASETLVLASSSATIATETATLSQITGLNYRANLVVSSSTTTGAAAFSLSISDGTLAGGGNPYTALTAGSAVVVGDYCSPGNFNQPSCTPCAKGRASGVANLAATLCPSCGSGRFGNETGLSACHLCLAGRSSTTVGAQSDTVCFQCTAGKAAPAGSTTCPPCQPGNFSANLRQTKCDQCVPGRYTDAAQQSLCKICSGGKYASEYGSNSVDDCLPCSAGRFSLTEAATCTPCGNGTFAPFTGLSQCEECAVGNYSAVEGLPACVQCPPGNFTAQTRSASCAPCAAGKYSDLFESSSCNLCQPGRYSDRLGLTLCDPCGAGNFSVIGSTICLRCKPGTFSTLASGKSALCTPCGLGNFSATNETSACQYCPTGRFAAQVGSSFCSMCPAGSASNAIGAVTNNTCVGCVPGKYSLADASICLECTPGNFSSIAQATACTVCPAGSYSDTSATSVCTLCGPGKYSSTPGATSATTCIECPAGTATNLEGQTACEDCTRGRFSVASAQTCTPCPGGTFADLVGSINCTVCPLGTASAATAAVSASTCAPCSAGSFANYTGLSSCELCFPGTFSFATGEITCKDCPFAETQDRGATECACTPSGNAALSDSEVVTQMSSFEGCTKISMQGRGITNSSFTDPQVTTRSVPLFALNLADNQITRVIAHSFTGLPLVNLDLSGNLITALESPFVNGNSIQSLNLADNALQMNANSFTSLTSLKALYLSNNGIVNNLVTKQLQDWTYTQPSSTVALELVDLRDNLIDGISPYMFSGAGSLSSVFLKGNFGCDVLRSSSSCAITTKDIPMADCNSFINEQCLPCSPGYYAVGLKQVVENNSLVTLPQCLSCVPPAACIGSYRCAEGYSGELCGHCKIGYYRAFTSCYSCESPRWWIPIMALFFVLVGVAGLLKRFGVNMYGMARIKQMWSYIQLSGFTLAMSRGWPDAIKEWTSLVAVLAINFEIVHVECIADWNYLNKFVSTVSAVCAIMLGATTYVTWAHHAAKQIVARADTILNNDVLVDQLNTQARRYRRRAITVHNLGAIVFTQVYPHIVRLSVASFFCDNTGGGWYLQSDSSFRCFDDPSWIVLAVFSSMTMFFFVLQFPFQLWWRLHDMIDGDLRQFDEKNFNTWGPWYQRYRGRYATFEIVFLARSALLALPPVLFKRDDLAQGIMGATVCGLSIVAVAAINPFNEDGFVQIHGDWVKTFRKPLQCCWGRQVRGRRITCNLWRSMEIGQTMSVFIMNVFSLCMAIYPDDDSLRTPFAITSGVLILIQWFIVLTKWEADEAISNSKAEMSLIAGWQQSKTIEQQKRDTNDRHTLQWLHFWPDDTSPPMGEDVISMPYEPKTAAKYFPGVLKLGDGSVKRLYKRLFDTCTLVEKSSAAREYFKASTLVRGQMESDRHALVRELRVQISALKQDSQNTHNRWSANDLELQRESVKDFKREARKKEKAKLKAELKKQEAADKKKRLKERAKKNKENKAKGLPLEPDTDDDELPGGYSESSDSSDEEWRQNFAGAPKEDPMSKQLAVAEAFLEYVRLVPPAWSERKANQLRNHVDHAVKSAVQDLLWWTHNHVFGAVEAKGQGRRNKGKKGKGKVKSNKKGGKGSSKSKSQHGKQEEDTVNDDDPPPSARRLTAAEVITGARGGATVNPVKLAKHLDSMSNEHLDMWDSTHGRRLPVDKLLAMTPRDSTKETAHSRRLSQSASKRGSVELIGITDGNGNPTHVRRRSSVDLTGRGRQPSVDLSASARGRRPSSGDLMAMAAAGAGHRRDSSGGDPILQRRLSRSRSKGEFAEAGRSSSTPNIGGSGVLLDERPGLTSVLDMELRPIKTLTLATVGLPERYDMSELVRPTQRAVMDRLRDMIDDLREVLLGLEEEARSLYLFDVAREITAVLLLPPHTEFHAPRGPGERIRKELLEVAKGARKELNRHAMKGSKARHMRQKHEVLLIILSSLATDEECYNKIMHGQHLDVAAQESGNVATMEGPGDAMLRATDIDFQG